MKIRAGHEFCTSFDKRKKKKVESMEKMGSDF